MSSPILDFNDNLICVEVDDVDYSNTNWWSIDSQSLFSTYCNNDCSSSTVTINAILTSKKLVGIFDMMGRETNFKPNTTLIYLYEDGTTEKVYTVMY